MKANTDIEQYLVRRSLEGDRNAQREIYQRYARAMYNVCYRMLNNANDAEDLLQESFVEMFKNLSKFRGESTLGAWLKRIVINRCLNQIKKRKLQLVEMDENYVSVAAEEKQSSDSPYNVAAIKKAITELPEGYRLVFNLYMIEGYDHAEIAGILGITESTSKSQLNRAKKKVRELLNVES